MPFSPPVLLHEPAALRGQADFEGDTWSPTLVTLTMKPLHIFASSHEPRPTNQIVTNQLAADSSTLVHE